MLTPCNPGRAGGGRVPLDAAALSPRQVAAVEALVNYGDVSAAAAAIGVNRTTIRRWRSSPAFAAALREAEAEAVAAVSRRLARIAAAALDVLEETIVDATAPTSLRLRAADLALSRLVVIREHADLEARIADLEAAVGDATECRTK